MILAQRRSWAVAGATVLLTAGLAGCGIQPTVVYVVGPPPSAINPSASASAQTITSSGQIYIYLLEGQGDTNLLTPVIRTITDQRIDEASVAEMLIKGPDPEEIKEGYSTEVPSDLQVSPNAGGFGDAYTLSTPLGSWAKAQFICTMQEYDQSLSVGYFYPKTEMSQVNWVACKDTTSQYIMLPGLSADDQPFSRVVTPLPTKNPVVVGK
ncbi:MAG TPA: hypothetical protein VGX23_04110 [Actinocrinis sp.]|nr:hypothetical protein [Actinocrinis sp.]